MNALTAIFGTSKAPGAGKPTVGAPDPDTGTVSGSLNFANKTGGTLKYSVSAQPTTGTVTVNTDGTYSFTPTQLARDTAAISAGTTNSTFKVTATNGRGDATVTVTVPIAPTVITGDSTAVFQDVFSNIAKGSTITLAQKTFYHSSVLRVEVAGLTINGNGAVLQATDDATSSVQILADNVTMNNLTLGANLTGPRYYAPEQHKLVVEGDHDTVSNVTINGSAGAGVYVSGAGWFTLNNITVNNSRADGIHMTDGAHDGVVNNPVTNGTGDDGVAVVSYISDGKPCYNITINNPIVNGTTWGRGISVVGGHDITYNNIAVSDTSAAGVYIASEPSYDTLGVNNVIINGGSVTSANTSTEVIHGAVMLYAGNPGQNLTNVTIENLSISETPTSAQRVIGMIHESGSSMSGIVFKDIDIDATTLPLAYTNEPATSYVATGITADGVSQEL